MPEVRFKRDAHLEVVALLSKLDRAFLERCKCYFGGGTRIVVWLGIGSARPAKRASTGRAPGAS